MSKPDVWLVIADSAIAFDETGEILETVEWNAYGQPDWSAAGICDHRGMGGPRGFDALARALQAAEENYYLGFQEMPNRVGTE